MDFRQYFKSRQGEIVNVLKQMVGRESPSQNKKAVDACAAFVAAEFKKSGMRVNRYPQRGIGDFYLLEYPASAKTAEAGQILVLTHVDTVWPVGQISKMPFYISGEKVFGPGVLDMKGSLAMAIFAFKAIHQFSLRTSKRIALFINPAEETGHEACHEMIAKLARKASLVLCLEPALPGGALKTQRKGRLVMRLEVKGRAAHAGTPEKGINAIEELAWQVRALKRLNAGGVTLSVNQVGGGEKPNIVAPSAWGVMDIRFWTGAQKDRIIRSFKHLKASKPGAKFSSSIESLTPPMEKTKASVQLFQRAKEIASRLEIPLEEGKTGGGSDASIASSLGIPTLDGLGPDGDGIHAEHEHLLLPSLVQRTALLTELLLQL